MPFRKLAMPFNRKALAAAALLSLTIAIPSAQAWGNSGHRMVGQEAMRALPPELPGFLRTAFAVGEIGELAREPDRWKGSGRVHDNDRDPAHFIDMEDDGTALGHVPMDPFPRTKIEYDTKIRAAGGDLFKAGYLPYALIDRYQQLVKDFAYWRVDVAALKTAKGERRKWIAADRKRREALILRDIGEFAHYVGDGSQPMHISVHYNGWGDYPNPKGYTQEKVHGPFEAEFVHANVSNADVRARMRAFQACAAPIETCVMTYLRGTLTQVEPFYQLYGQGAFGPGDARGKAFAAERVAAGASQLRDMIVWAWRASDESKVGWPEVSVKDVEAGKVDAWDALYGKD
jgi:hypothetical protein